MAQRFKPGQLIQATISEIKGEKTDTQLWKEFMSAKAGVLEDLYQDYLTDLAYARLRGSVKILNQSVMELPIPSHAKNILKNSGIVTVRDLLQYSSFDLFHMPGFGQKSLNIIEDYLSQVGFELSKNPHTSIK